MGVYCSDSVSHNWVQVLSILVLLLAYSQDWICNHQMIVSFEGSWVEDWIKKSKQVFLTALTTAIKKPTTSIKKHTNELKVHEKTVRTAIKQDLSPDLNPLDYAIWGILENKTNETSHSNIGLLKTAIEKEWNKISEEFILKACKSFQRHVESIIKKMVAILSKFTVLCLSSSFVVDSLKLDLILFYNKVVYYYTRIFLILLLHPIYIYVILCEFLPI